jgi:hypothetical protein
MERRSFKRKTIRRNTLGAQLRIIASLLTTSDEVWSHHHSPRVITIRKYSNPKAITINFMLKVVWPSICWLKMIPTHGVTRGLRKTRVFWRTCRLFKITLINGQVAHRLTVSWERRRSCPSFHHVTVGGGRDPAVWHVKSYLENGENKNHEMLFLVFQMDILLN